MRLAWLVLLAGCGGGAVPAMVLQDGGTADAGTPAAGESCPAMGSGACSADGGDLLRCGDAGWAKIDDCRNRGSCFEDTGRGVLRCNNDGPPRCWDQVDKTYPGNPVEVPCRDAGAAPSCCTDPASTRGAVVISVCACKPSHVAPESYCEDLRGDCTRYLSGTQSVAVTDGRFSGSCDCP